MALSLLVCRSYNSKWCFVFPARISFHLPSSSYYTFGASLLTFFLLSFIIEQFRLWWRIISCWLCTFDLFVCLLCTKPFLLHTFSFSLLKTVFQDGGAVVLTDNVSLKEFMEQLKEMIVSSITGWNFIEKWKFKCNAENLRFDDILRLPCSPMRIQRSSKTWSLNCIQFSLTVVYKILSLLFLHSTCKLQNHTTEPDLLEAGNVQSCCLCPFWVDVLSALCTAWRYRCRQKNGLKLLEKIQK